MKYLYHITIKKQDIKPGYKINMDYTQPVPVFVDDAGLYFFKTKHGRKYNCTFLNGIDTIKQAPDMYRLDGVKSTVRPFALGGQPKNGYSKVNYLKTGEQIVSNLPFDSFVYPNRNFNKPNHTRKPNMKLFSNFINFMTDDSSVWKRLIQWPIMLIIYPIAGVFLFLYMLILAIAHPFMTSR